jgi:hypothetical protein
MRLRLALHAGEVERGGNGWVGTDLNVACRLVDAATLRNTLRATPQAQLVVCVSNEWFHTVIERNPDLFDQRSYTPITVTEKELHTTAWLHIPAHVPETPNGHIAPNGWSVPRHEKPNG